MFILLLMFTRLSSVYNSLTPRPIDICVIASACQVPSIHIGCALQLQAEWRTRVESLLGLPVHATANACLSQFIHNNCHQCNYQPGRKLLCINTLYGIEASYILLLR